ncbi:MAG: hypothetical protein WDO72_14755 [Pseudomonadota bacterium]
MTAQSFVEKVVLADDCVLGLKSFDVHEFWIRECAKRQGSHKNLYAEFARRTTANVVEVRLTEGSKYAVVQFKGPEQLAFSMALSRAGLCLGNNDTLWPSGKLTGCGKEFWTDIPIVEYAGAIPLECRDEHWAVVTPNKSLERTRER